MSFFWTDLGAVTEPSGDAHSVLPKTAGAINGVIAFAARRLYYSSNAGITWTSGTTGTLAASNLDRAIIATGQVGADPPLFVVLVNIGTQIAYSTDCVSFADGSGYPGHGGFGYLIFCGDRWIIVNDDATHSNIFDVSLDGKTWSTGAMSGVGQWDCGAYSPDTNNIVVLAGSPGAETAVAVSADKGTSWSDFVTPVAGSWYRCCWAGGAHFVATEKFTGSRILHSANNGHTWSVATSLDGVENVWSDGAGKVIAVAAENVGLTPNSIMSTDFGATWTDITTAAINNLNGVTFQSPYFFAMGTNASATREAFRLDASSPSGNTGGAPSVRRRQRPNMETFRPAGDTVLINAAGMATPSGTLLPIPTGGATAYRIFNQGFNDAFIGFGPTSASAVTSSVIPIIGAGSPAQSLPAGQVMHLIMAPQTYVAARALMESSNVYITPGHILPPNP